MKKVLALVLAVIMVCTMAMAAVYVDVDQKLEITGDTTLAKITLKADERDTTDFSKVYYLKVPTAYFALLGRAFRAPFLHHPPLNLCVRSGVNGAFFWPSISPFLRPAK